MRSVPSSERTEDNDDMFLGEHSWTFRNGLMVRAYQSFVDAAIGGVVTAHSVSLSRFAAEQVPKEWWHGRLCVELGAGCGLVSNTLRQLKTRTIATDLLEVRDHLTYNLDLNCPSDGMAPDDVTCCCDELDWTSVTSRKKFREKYCRDGADAILGANCIYGHSMVSPFLETIQGLLSLDGIALICGLPKPNFERSGGEPNFLDAFIAGLMCSGFDCYLLANIETNACGAGTKEGVPPVSGLGRQVAWKHGTPPDALVDNIWLLTHHEVKPPPWAQIHFKLNPELRSDAIVPVETCSW